MQWHLQAYVSIGSIALGLTQPAVIALFFPTIFSLVQLNKTILLEQLRIVGFSQERAQEVLQQQSNKGWIFVTKVDDQDWTHEFQIFRPRASAPCVTDTELARLYNKLALLWMEELERPQPRAAAQSRNTRLQERAAAEQQERLRTEGLNPIQLQQMTDAVNAAMKPVVDAQQQQGARVEAVAVGYDGVNNTFSQLQQIMPALTAFSNAYNQQVLGQPGAANSAAGAV